MVRKNFFHIFLTDFRMWTSAPVFTSRFGKGLLWSQEKRVEKDGEWCADVRETKAERSN